MNKILGAALCLTGCFILAGGFIASGLVIALVGGVWALDDPEKRP